ncbi:hypothetical protein [Vibrio nigripulchritudo]|uniref:hypothetical protein n=1 Tax=Vibrio nigripulchritudo TaxID=28173 RepID=UPI00249207E5|nr:hypothetical protein [Vibrio nigripulchritudo]
MPAILKDAVLRSYEVCGWDLRDSTSTLSSPLFPTFADLLIQLESVIAQSAYSDEMKSNYTGALVTRVRSMVNGLNVKYLLLMKSAMPTCSTATSSSI